MGTVKLVIPCAEYLHSYLEACHEFSESDKKIFSIHDPDRFDDWKETIFLQYEHNRLGIDLPENHVPSTRFWLVDNGEFTAAGDIRHWLTPALEKFGGHIGYFVRPSKWNQGYGTVQLRLLLREAFKLGIKRALVTCDDGNIGSYRVIEKNGGVHQDTIDIIVDGQSHHTRRYWIDIVSELGK